MRTFILASAAALMASTAPAQAPQPPQPPKLLIAISVDQFSADLFDEYRPHFTAGLKRLASGTVFRNGYQGQAATETCPGHSTILTGALPAHTGIIGNVWIDQSVSRKDKTVYCAEDERAPGSDSDHYRVSPVHLDVPTLGDLLKKQSPQSLNVAVAGKDRAAVMMSGHNADQRWYWNGKGYVTDLATTRPPASVAQVNAIVQQMVAAPAQAMVPGSFCQSKATPIALSDTLTVGNGRFAREAGDYSAFRASPAFDAATLALAAALVQELQLGRDAAPDILSVGLSATDYVGHAYGPGGQEMCLNLEALDQDLAGFFNVLDGQHLDYAVVLTADHGGLDIPERLHATQPQAVRADSALSAGKVGTDIGAKLGLSGPVLFGGIGGDVYIDRSLTAAERARVEAEALRIYRAHPQVEAVFTADQLASEPIPSGDPQGWSLLQRARASFDRERSGDFIVLLKKWVMPIARPRKGFVATHGSPWDYDRRVPVLFWRAGMAPADRPDGIDTASIMPTLAALVGVSIDAGGVDGRCLAAIEGVACPSR